jgi:drug/metabolite transporter (DMT)-like permease
MTPTTRGILCIIAGTMLLATQDAIVKLLTVTYSPGEVMFIRNICSFVLLAYLVQREGGWRQVKAKNPRLVWIRGILGFLTSFVIVASFQRLPLADAMAVLFAAPLFVALMQGPFLGEKVGGARWAIIWVGFLGVLVMLRPTPDGLDWVMLFPLAAALLSATRDTVTRKLAGVDSSTTLLLYTQVAGAIGGAFFLSGDTPVPEWWQLGAFFVAGSMVGLAHYLTITAFHLAQGATVAPFRYFSLLWGVVLGYTIWGDIPDWWIAAGTLLVVGSGLAMLQLERRKHRRAPVPQ